jgi:hypothetical protein
VKVTELVDAGSAGPVAVEILGDWPPLRLSSGVADDDAKNIKKKL